MLGSVAVNWTYGDFDNLIDMSAFEKVLGETRRGQRNSADKDMAVLMI